MHPELAFEERETVRFLRNALEEAGIEILDAGTETGLIARIVGNGPGRITGLRCDIDALPVKEETSLPYASLTEGIMHACGHDFHAAVMLGAAFILKETSSAWPGEVKIVFQPAEETAGGAEKVVACGHLNDVERFFGVHSYPAEPAGWLGVREGAVMAAVDRFRVTLHGMGTHAAHPHKGVDPIPALAALVQALQTIVSRSMDPFAPRLLSITHLEAGNTWNVIPETAMLEGTIRTLDAADRTLMEAKFRQIVDGVAAAHGVDAQIDWTSGSPAVVNDAALCALARQTAARCGLTPAIQENTLGAEDFSRYGQGRPALFVRVGTGGAYPAHHPKFTVDEAALFPAAHFFAELTLDCLNA